MIYLIRHAYAGERGDPRWPDDSQRPLTKDGRKRFKKAIDRLFASGDFTPQRIATSPYVRCRQTAELTAEALPVDCPVEALAALEPDGSLADALAWTRGQEVDAVAWVGHAPTIEEFAAALLGMPNAHVRMPKGAIAAIDFADAVEIGRGELRWLVTTKLLV